MKVLNDLSIKDLKLNKKRSAVIIIGIILSTALICGVTGLISSFQYTLVEEIKDNGGNYHTIFYDVPKDELKYIEENRNISQYYLSEELGCSYLKNGEGEIEEKSQYVNVISMDDGYLNNMGISLIEGRLPENDSEIVISNRIRMVFDIDYKVGDSIDLNIGERQLSDGTKLDKHNSYISDTEESGEILQEELVNTYEKTYKIVGIIERPTNAIEPYDAPWYTVITKMEKIKQKANIAVLYNDAFKYKENTEMINQMIKLQDGETKDNAATFNGMKGEFYTSYKYNININRDLLAYEGANLSDSSMKMIYALGGFIMAIVLISSVFVIRNGFAISVTERMKQYGMLSSIGTTKKQIKKSVYFEGFILGLIGIPLGILSGVLAIFILLKVVNAILYEYINSEILLYSISWLGIVLSIIISIVTIWLSCKSSAKRASKITPIEAIRSNDDIKLKEKKMRCPKIITKLFNVGGEIAYKNLKRSKKKYRTTIISIIVSIVTFISISSFIEYGFKMSEAYYTEIGYNLSIYELDRGNNIKNEEKYKRFLEIGKLNGVNEYSIIREKHIQVDTKESLTEFGKKVKLNDYVDEEEREDSLIITSLGKDEYQRFLKKIGGKYDDYKDGAILIDNCITYDSEGKTIRGNLYEWKKDDVITGKVLGEDANNNIISIKILAKTDERPMGLEEQYNTTAYLIVSDEYIEKIGYTYLNEMVIKAKDSYKVEEEIRQFYKEKNINENDIMIANKDKAVRENNAIVFVISIFLYGFIAVITAIGITNIFNTITTNMNLRKKEFAMLKSIGMTKKEFNRMIRLESIFYGFKSLIIGIPIGIILSYFIYKIFDNNMGMSFVLPYKAILISIVFVAIVIGIIMKYSMNKINKQNIIETIRNDNI